jgi:putative transcriptional regulator
MELFNQLKIHRAVHNLTQAELALKVGVSRKTINTVENGIFIPSTVLSLKIAEVLNVKVEDIFSLRQHDSRY